MFVNLSAQPAVTFDPAEQLDHTLCFLAAVVEQEGAMAASSSHEVKAPTEEVEKAASKKQVEYWSHDGQWYCAAGEPGVNSEISVTEVQNYVQKLAETEATTTGIGQWDPSFDAEYENIEDYVNTVQDCATGAFVFPEGQMQFRMALAVALNNLAPGNCLVIKNGAEIPSQLLKVKPQRKAKPQPLSSERRESEASGAQDTRGGRRESEARARRRRAG